METVHLPESGTDLRYIQELSETNSYKAIVLYGHVNTTSNQQTERPLILRSKIESDVLA
jgi:site-specific recombinase XerD